MAENELPCIQITKTIKASGITIEEKTIVVKDKDIKECERLVDKYD